MESPCTMPSCPINVLVELPASWCVTSVSQHLGWAKAGSVGARSRLKGHAPQGVRGGGLTGAGPRPHSQLPPRPPSIKAPTLFSSLKA